MGEQNIISTRLKALRTNLNLSQKAFGTKIGIAQTSYANYEGGKSPIPSNILEQLSISTNVNLNWLVTGEGTMFRSGDSFEEENTICSVNNEDKYTYLVPMTNLKVSAGKGVEWESGEECDKLSIPQSIYRVYKSYELAGVTVCGDSMEPTLRDGEPVVYAKGVLESDGIYVISILDELFVKRLSIDLLDRKVTIISDNPLYSPKTYPMEKEGFQILGKVIFWIHMEQRLRMLGDVNK